MNSDGAEHFSHPHNPGSIPLPICRGCGRVGAVVGQACPNCGLADLIDTQPFLIEALKGILEEALNGLKWYRDMYPEADSPADDELVARIERAIQ